MLDRDADVFYVVRRGYAVGQRQLVNGAAVVHYTGLVNRGDVYRIDIVDNLGRAFDADLRRIERDVHVFIVVITVFIIYGERNGLVFVHLYPDENVGNGARYVRVGVDLSGIIV